VSGIWLPLAATAAAAGTTYFACVRPMRRDKGCGMDMSRPGAASGGCEAQDAPDHAEEIRKLREEVQLLTHEVELRESAGPRDAAPVGLPATHPGTRHG